jgi:matrix metalloproteinase-14 (membrane-inserted)
MQGIQALYGKKTKGNDYNPAPPAKPTVVKTGDNELCKNSKIDAIFNTPDGNTYAFKDDKYFKLTENAIAEGYPKDISEGWPKLPRNDDFMLPRIMSRLTSLFSNRKH